MNKGERIKEKEADSRILREGGSPLPHPPYSCPERSRRAVLHSSSRLKREGGFTLMELVIVMFIILILATGVVLVIDPVEQVRRSRDTARVSDVQSLKTAIDQTLAESVLSGGADMDGSEVTSCAGEATDKVFVSVPSSEAPPIPSDLPSGWSYKQVAAATLYDVDGAGWMPIDLTLVGSNTPVISNLPVDPINTFASGQYYTYVCDRSSRNFELTTRLNSNRFQTGGEQDAQSNDGGDDVFAYEAGSDLALNPKAPVGYWAFDEGSGTTTTDSSGYGNNGTFQGDPQWELSNCRNGFCIDFDGVTDRVNVSDSSSLDITGNALTLTAWFQPNVDVDGMFGGGWPILIGKRPWQVGGYMAHFWDNGGVDDGLINTQYCWSGSCASTKSATLFTANNWYHYVGTLEALMARTYINGTQESQQGITQAMASSAGTNLRISGDFNGIIDEVAIYNRTMTPQEIAYQYEALKP